MIDLDKTASIIFNYIYPNYPPNQWKGEIDRHMHEGERLGHSVEAIAYVRQKVEAALEPLRAQAEKHWTEKTKDWPPEC